MLFTHLWRPSRVLSSDSREMIEPRVPEPPPQAPNMFLTMLPSAPGPEAVPAPPPLFCLSLSVLSCWINFRFSSHMF